MSPRRSAIAILAALALLGVAAGPASAQDDHCNAFDAATPLVPNEAVRGRIDARGDVDVFSLIVCGGDHYTIRVRIWPQGQAILDLLAADGRTLLASDRDDEGAETLEISWTARASATHYVSLRALRYDDSGGAFEVTLTTLRGLSLTVPPLVATRTSSSGQRSRDAASRSGNADAPSAARERREAEREERLRRARERREQARQESEARRADRELQRELRQVSEEVRRRGSQQSPDEPAGMGRAWRCTVCGAYTRNSRECPECRRRGLRP